MESIVAILEWIELALLAPLGLFGLHRGVACLRLLLQPSPGRSGRVHTARDDGALPLVTVQLPVYDERHVAARLVRAAAHLDYPADRLEIQVLDDSDDDTTTRIAAEIRRLGAERPHGPRIRHVRRTDRQGFKAGALAAGLATARGELVAVFDADFVPPRDFLRRTVGAFDDPRVGCVQACWDHLDADFDLLTAAQADLLDGHFHVEQDARDRAGLFFNFNGTAGVLRRSAIDDAGGWTHDTITEDLDLSYRAQLRGWRFVFDRDTRCPAELPTDMAAFLKQQHRWAKGAMQTARKLVRRLVVADLPWSTRTEATMHLCGHAAFPVMLGLILLSLPLQVGRSLQTTPDGGPAALLPAAASLPTLVGVLSVLCYLAIARVRAGRTDLGGFLRLPLALCLGAGLAVGNTVAVWEGLTRDAGVFERTPKHGVVGRARAGSGYATRRGVLPWIELACAAWVGTSAILALVIGLPWTAAFHAMFATGLGWVGVASLRGAALRRSSTVVEPGGATAPRPVALRDDARVPTPRPTQTWTA
jgi:hypothetical protein